MRDQNYSAGIVRMCAWCGVSLETAEMPAASWMPDSDDVPVGPHTHTICQTCLTTHFAEDHPPAGIEAPFEPVPVLRRR